MGNSALRDLSTIDNITLNNLSGKVLAIDAHNWLYKYLTTTVRYTNTKDYTTEEGEEMPVVVGAMKGIPRFYKQNIVPVFVFDGVYHEFKQEEIEDRKQKKQNAKGEYKKHAIEGNEILASKYESRSTRLTQDAIDRVQNILDILEIDYIEAPQSGESQAAYMTQTTPSVYGCSSDDYDSLLFNSAQTIRNITSPDNLERITIRDTLNELNITQQQLVDIAILCGTDYNEGVYGYGPKKSLKAVKGDNTVEDIFKENDVENYEEIRDIFLNPKVTKISSVKQNLTNPELPKLHEYLYRILEFESGKFETQITKMDENTQQTISDW